MLPFSYLARYNEKNNKLHALILTEMEKWLQLTVNVTASWALTNIN